MLARRPHVGFLGAWCFITLAPTSSIVPIATEVGAERRMYLAACGARGAGRPVRLSSVDVASDARESTRSSQPPLRSYCVWRSAAATMQRNSEYAIEALDHEDDRRAAAASALVSDARERLLRGGSTATRHCDTSRLAKEDPTASFMLGVELVSGGQLAAGAEELERFVRLRPLHVSAVDARESLGRVYSSTNQLDRAAAHLAEVLRLEPRRGTAHAFHGRLCSCNRDERAKRCESFRSPSDLQPGNLEALRQLGIAQGQSGQLEAAVETFRRAIELYPKSSRGSLPAGERAGGARAGCRRRAPFRAGRRARSSERRGT